MVIGNSTFTAFATDTGHLSFEDVVIEITEVDYSYEIVDDSVLEYVEYYPDAVEPEVEQEYEYVPDVVEPEIEWEYEYVPDVVEPEIEWEYEHVPEITTPEFEYEYEPGYNGIEYVDPEFVDYVGIEPAVAWQISMTTDADLLGSEIVANDEIIVTVRWSNAGSPTTQIAVNVTDDAEILISNANDVVFSANGNIRPVSNVVVGNDSVTFMSGALGGWYLNK